MPLLKVRSPNVQYTAEEIVSTFSYDMNQVTKVAENDDEIEVLPVRQTLTFKTQRRVPRVGVMLVGWGGNNGSTVTAAILANRQNVTWNTRRGTQRANYYGSITQCATVRVGGSASAGGADVYLPFNQVIPMLHPNDLFIDGWDINSADLATAMRRAEVLDYDLQQQLAPQLAEMRPRPSAYFPEWIASNQAERADNVIQGTKRQILDQLRADIRDFKSRQRLDKVIVLWTANTEKFADVVQGVNDTADNLLKAIDAGATQIAPSTLFAVASILEGCSYLNGSPQNTFVPGVVELATQRRVYIGGDDFKSGQTKMKSVLVDFLIGAGIKPVSIVSYNHLGNNDGRNLSAPEQFRSKEISKSNVVDDMVRSNNVLYAPGEHPDHVVVIKYVPYVGDSKRAMDEYTSEIFMGGTNTIVLHNTCEDSLLAAPIIIDLIIVTELFERIQYKTPESTEWDRFHSVLSVLSFFFKAPIVPTNTPVVNALFRQRSSLENIVRACVGLPPENYMMLEHKVAAAGDSTNPLFANAQPLAPLTLEGENQQQQQHPLKQRLVNGATNGQHHADTVFANGVTNGVANGHH